jgi:transcriptional regulator with XRE-family HTH domain
MGHSIFTEEYSQLILLLRAAREKAGVTQQELARRLGQTQSFVSKCERGERRIDVIELRHFCKALNADFPKFIASINSGKRRV